MKKAIVAGLIVAALALTGCTDITKAYKPIGTAWTAVYFPGGDNNWFNNGTEAQNADATKGVKVTTVAGYLSSWDYAYKNALTDGNREFKYVLVAKWDGDKGWGGLDAAKSTGVVDAGGNIKIAPAFANGSRVIVTLSQGAFDEATLSLAKDVVTVRTAP